MEPVRLKPRLQSAQTFSTKEKKMKTISKVRIVALIALAGVSLAACNTFHGMGEDTSDAGHAVERAAD
jgi:predicted small secreted protein